VVGQHGRGHRPGHELGEVHDRDPGQLHVELSVR
jgi:hypothetical protein